MMHPTDPGTMDKLDLEDSITVNKYTFKLVDAVGCLYCFSIFKRFFKFLKGKLLRKKQKYYLKPDSMKDVPDSDSDSETNDTFKGLSPAAIYLGEGAVLYLQMMKTFAFLFFFLTVLNIPVFWMYASMTKGNNYTEMEEAFKYFTLGNLGKGNPICGYSNIDYSKSQQIFKGELDEPDQNIFAEVLEREVIPKIELKCPRDTSYMQSLKDVGFVYSLNLQTGDFSQAKQICHQIHNPIEKFDNQALKESRVVQYKEMVFEESL